MMAIESHLATLEKARRSGAGNFRCHGVTGNGQSSRSIPQAQKLVLKEQIEKLRIQVTRH